MVLDNDFPSTQILALEHSAPPLILVAAKLRRLRPPLTYLRGTFDSRDISLLGIYIWIEELRIWDCSDDMVFFILHIIAYFSLFKSNRSG
jgi:hypothetical protein